MSFSTSAYTFAMFTHPNVLVDWSQCSLVEVNPRKVSGAPLLRGTRVQADAILENYQDGSPLEEISENFAVPLSSIRELLAFADHQKNPPRQ